MLFVLFTYTWLKILKIFPYIHAPMINLSMCCLHTSLCPLHSSKDLPRAFLRIINDNVPNLSLFPGITIHKLPAKCLVHIVDSQQIVRYRRSIGQAPSSCTELWEEVLSFLLCVSSSILASST